jgi:hypothetical protein
MIDKAVRRSVSPACAMEPYCGLQTEVCMMRIDVSKTNKGVMNLGRLQNSRPG